MELISDPKVMQSRCNELRKSSKKIVFVPTMGGLHEGHLSLVRKAQDIGDIIIMSIYLNPTQFAENEDLKKYPANFEIDIEMAKGAGVDIVFCPNNETIYPEGFQTFVETTEITKVLCGASRPGHFRGVTTIVLKLFNIIRPTCAIFGEKDYQQLRVIKTMVKDLNLDVKIVSAPTVREEDGLAMSSRNAYLKPAERQAARAISEALKHAAESVKNGEKDVKKLASSIKKRIESTKIGKIDYVKFCHPKTLKELNTLELPAVIAVAADFGSARLIDNCILE